VQHIVACVFDSGIFSTKLLKIVRITVLLRGGRYGDV